MVDRLLILQNGAYILDPHDFDALQSDPNQCFYPSAEAATSVLLRQVRAIPFKKLLAGVSALDFLGHPAAISENNSDHPAAISAKQVGPPPTIQFHPFGGTLQ